MGGKKSCTNTMSRPERVVEQWAALQKAAANAAKAQANWKEEPIPHVQGELQDALAALDIACRHLRNTMKRLADALGGDPSPAIKTALWLTGFFGNMKNEWDNHDMEYYLESSALYKLVLDNGVEITEVAPLFIQIFTSLEPVLAAAVEQLAAPAAVAAN